MFGVQRLRTGLASVLYTHAMQEMASAMERIGKKRKNRDDDDKATFDINLRSQPVLSTPQPI